MLVLTCICAALLAACGSGAASPSAVGSAGTTAPVDNGAAITAAPINATAFATVAAAETSAPTAPAATTTRTDVSPVPCPEPASATSTTDCDKLYTTLLAKYGEDYSQCQPDSAVANACQKPDSLQGELKEQINIQLMLDSSGSMAADLGGQRKMDIAKQVMTTFVDTVPKEANIALRVYGHTGSNDNADRPESCKGTELFYPFQPLNTTLFKSAIAGFDATGWTPIAASLQAAQQDFAPYKGDTNTNIIYMVSDGIETCDGDPVAAARALHEADIAAVVNIVGFDVDPAAAEQLRAAAAAGGGQYFEARSADELNEVFTEQIDWQEWNKYYGCAFRAANQQAGEVFRDQNEAVACTVQTANKEFGAIFGDINTNYVQYGDCAKSVGDLFQARYKRITSVSLDNFNETVDNAKQEYQSAVDAARSEYTDTVNKLTPTP